ncbi:MAG: Ku protein [Clostridiaceae bacterium]|jgi:DNA end-binding protein Ku|nr:Ku protein [Clostridiaceae bacterium]
MHTVWKGAISFGLVNIPIKMFTATEDKDIKFRYIHKSCNTPLNYKKVCPSCNIEVSEEEIVKGYEYEPGHFVVLKDEDFKAIQGKSGPKNIEILDFVKLSEIDPVYFNKTYYLAPQDIDGKAYNLLRRAMDQTGKIAIARVAIRNRQTLAAIRVYRDALVMETLFYADEVRPSEQIPNLPRNTDADEKELDIAVKLIDSLTVEFKPEKYTNEYRTVLSELISRKIEGEEIRVAPTVPKSNVIDLMEALKASLQETKKKTGRKSAQPKKKKAGKAV